MALVNSKKGFAFSFFAFFLVMLIFVFAELDFNGDDISKTNNFEHNRIVSVDLELKYFEDVIFQDSLTNTFRNTIINLVNKSKDPIFYSNYIRNYSKFNDLVYEGIINSSFDGVGFSGNSVYNSTENYINNFNLNYRGDLTYNITDIRVFEENPYYLMMQIDYLIGVDLVDNLTSWDFNNSIVVSIPVFGMESPRHFLTMGLNSSMSPEVESVELYSSNLNWTRDLLNETIDLELSSIYYDNQYKYTIGNSYLNNLFNRVLTWMF